MGKYTSGCPVKFINNAVIICQDHPNVVSTSNLPYGELSSKAMQLIAQIKLKTREKVKKNHQRNKSGKTQQRTKGS